jgi:murein DD-endopeptidase MepM/ murein hydrolase activator NlpD
VKFTTPTRAARLTTCVLALALAGCAIPRWPVQAPISSPFGLRLVDYWPAIHHGVDLVVPEGTPVRAMAPGRVVYAGWMGGYGNTILLDHGRGTATLYAHLSTLQVQPGQTVSSRDVIALSGSTGNARGAHLHFEVRRRGRAEDPVPLLGGPPRR